MKKFILSILLLTSVVAIAQTGINTTSPKATLDIKAKTTDGSQVEGLLIPRLEGNAIYAMPTANLEKGTQVYALSAVNATPQMVQLQQQMQPIMLQLEQLSQQYSEAQAQGNQALMTQIEQQSIEIYNNQYQPLEQQYQTLQQQFTNTSGINREGLYYWNGTRWVTNDIVVGNEITNITPNMGLERSGEGTEADPYTVGLPKLTTEDNESMMVWNGTRWNKQKKVQIVDTKQYPDEGFLCTFENQRMTIIGPYGNWVCATPYNRNSWIYTGSVYLSGGEKNAIWKTTTLIAPADQKIYILKPSGLNQIGNPVGGDYMIGDSGWSYANTFYGRNSTAYNSFRMLNVQMVFTQLL